MADEYSTEKVDLLIVGAGPHGLSVASTYHTLHPTSPFLILDSALSLGGVWASERLYKDLYTNNRLGTYEFPDFEMDAKKLGMEGTGHIPGSIVHDYLQAYAEKKDLVRFMRLDTKVMSIESIGDEGWIVVFFCQGEHGILRAKKLVLATGLTSTPRIPLFKGQEEFTPPILHTKNLATLTPPFLSKLNRVVVYGANKSGCDASYTLASNGIHVHLLVRENGGGPAWMTPALLSPLRLRLENLAATRLFSLFSPTLNPDDGYVLTRRFLHHTLLGRFHVWIFWWILEIGLRMSVPYEINESMRRLKPWKGPFDVTTSLAFHTYPVDFWRLVGKGMITVHVTEIGHLEGRSVCLTGGQRLEVDALILSTGWESTPSIKVLPENLDLGLPGSLMSDTESKIWSSVEGMILKEFSFLEKPRTNESSRFSSPASKDKAQRPFYNLTRHMIPPQYPHKTIAFAGAMQTGHTPILAYIQGLWICAYFDDEISFPKSPAHQSSSIPPNQLLKDTTLATTFHHLRYPKSGKVYPSFMFDILPYADLLLRDLGLEEKRRWWFRDVFMSWSVSDFEGLLEEWSMKKKVD